MIVGGAALSITYRTLDKPADNAKAEDAKQTDTKSTTEHDPPAEITRVPEYQWRSTKPSSIGKSGTAVLVAVSPNKGAKHVPIAPDQPQQNYEQISDKAQAELARDVPRKFAINSQRLMKAIGKHTKQDILNEYNTWVYPFKYLLHYEREIRAGYVEVCNRYESLRLKPATSNEASAANTMLSKDIAKSTTADSKKQESDAKESRAPTELEDAAKEKALWGCVIEFMDNDMRDIFNMRLLASKDVLEEIEFENLWYLYSPGDIVYHKLMIGGKPRHRAYRVLFVTGGREILDTANRVMEPLSTYGSKFEDSFEDFDDKTNEHRRMRGKTKGKTPLVLDCFYIDFDGDRWGPRPRRFVIPEFGGSKSIRALEVVPVRFMPDWKDVETKLLDRGKRFVDAAAGAHVLYSGRGHPDKWLGMTQEEVRE